MINCSDFKNERRGVISSISMVLETFKANDNAFPTDVKSQNEKLFTETGEIFFYFHEKWKFFSFEWKNLELKRIKIIFHVSISYNVHNTTFIIQASNSSYD